MKETMPQRKPKPGDLISFGYGKHFDVLLLYKDHDGVIKNVIIHTSNKDSEVHGSRGGVQGDTLLKGVHIIANLSNVIEQLRKDGKI